LFDASPWLSPLATENPSGESLRNDRRFHDLERLMQPQVEVVRDERNNPVSQVQIPVDWGSVLRLAEELRPQGRDLRLLVIVARALANTDGLRGLADGLGLIARSFEAHWTTMHPELRSGAPPRDAALRRINALLQLQNGEDGLLGDLRQTTFFAPRGVGPITGRDLERAVLDGRAMLNEAASGLSEAEKNALAAAHDQLLNKVRAGCAAHAAQAPTEFTALVNDARAARASLADLETVLTACLEGAAVTLPELARFLDRITTTLDRANASPAPSDTAAAKPNGAAMPDSQAFPMSTGTAVSAGPAAFPDRLSSREDVVRCLDLIIGFYDRTEPSSPIPHIARRVRRMVPMDFLELMEDLAPSGLKEFRVLAGVSEGKKTAQKDER
jgi:type VI secretion system protein ImpA